MLHEKSPADRAIDAFGGVKPLAEAIGHPTHRVYRWRQRRETGGTGGQIPATAQGPILAAAQKLGLPLTAEDLIDMRPAAAPAPAGEGVS